MKAIATGTYLLGQMALYLTCVLGLGILGGVCAAQDSAPRAVSGIVTSADGSTVEGACVSALPMESNAGNSGCNRTDQQGRFRLTLRPGRYVLRAKDEATGYPDPMFLLSSDPAAGFPEIVVSESDVSGVKVVLGSRGGTLDGEIRDSNSGLPISGAKVTIRDKHNPAAYVEVFSDANGRFQFTVPAKPVSVSATAKGYKSSSKEEVVLSGGQHRTLDIHLEKG
jgi:hypothetical protein